MDHMIKKIEIIGLYSNRNFTVEFENNSLILVGENGAGKTTISRIIFAVLSCNWDLLKNYSFEKIVLHFENKTIVIPETIISDIYRIPEVDRIGFYFDRQSARRSISNNTISAIIEIKNAIDDKQNRISRMYGMPYELIKEIIDKKPVNDLLLLTKELEDCFSPQIIYLPTYRRIEEQLQNIFPDVDMETWERRKRKPSNKRAVELVEFGMGDVKRLVEDELEKLRSFSQAQQNKLTLGYLGEIVSKKYDHSESYKKIRELNEAEINEVLSRIDASILSDDRKKQLMDTIRDFRSSQKHSYSAQVKIICHYFMQLWDFNKEIKNAEYNIREFTNTANRYLVNNIIIYNSDDYSCEVYNLLNHGKEKRERIDFQDLSSGEKQIVSLFSHLYLDNNDSIFVFIDEPELSLSVDWQRTFLLDIVKSPKFKGLLATTHSPFVFDNELECIVHGLNEFETKD